MYRASERVTKQRKTSIHKLCIHFIWQTSVDLVEMPRLSQGEEEKWGKCLKKSRWKENTQWCAAITSELKVHTLQVSVLLFLSLLSHITALLSCRPHAQTTREPSCCPNRFKPLHGGQSAQDSAESRSSPDSHVPITTWGAAPPTWVNPRLTRLFQVESSCPWH